MASLAGDRCGSGRAVGRGRGGAAPVGGLGKFDLYQAGFDASWELDLFGAKRRAVEADRARLAAKVENQRDVQVSMAAEIARNGGWRSRAPVSILSAAPSI